MPNYHLKIAISPERWRLYKATIRATNDPARPSSVPAWAMLALDRAALLARGWNEDGPCWHRGAGVEPRPFYSIEQAIAIEVEKAGAERDEARERRSD